LKTIEIGNEGSTESSTHAAVFASVSFVKLQSGRISLTSGQMRKLFSPKVCIAPWRRRIIAYSIRGTEMAGTAALIHPGEILLTEFMEPLGLTAYRLAKDLAVPAPRVGDIVRGKRAISADTALRLGIYFGLPAQFWLNLQNEFDLRRAASSSALKRVARRTA
jgi:addiction module HigA family antidote